MSAGVLTLNVNCQGPKCDCPGNDKIPGLEVKKETNIGGVTNFIKYTHYLEGRTFKLNTTLKDGNQIIGGFAAKRGQPVEAVKEVSVYYWDGNNAKPILLGIKKGEDTKYYSKGSSWLHTPVAHLSEQEALDEHNCQKNNAVVFDIKNAHSGHILKEYKANCMNKTRKIESETSPNPPGSEYIAKAHIIRDNDRDTRISRVTYNGKPTDIDPTKHGPASQIRLYSYPGSDSVPLMIEFKPSNNRISRWFESTDQSGKEWLEVYDSGNTFYDNVGTPQPTSKLSEKLDEVLCKRHDNVTLDLSSSRTNGSYCCGTHKSRVNVSEGSVKVKGEGNLSTKYYKHSMTPGTQLAGIYYTVGGQRKNIKLHGSRFPTSVNNVYAFYCKGDRPSLMYVDSDSVMTKGWYKEGSGEWRWTHAGTKPENFESKDLDCKQWQKLKKYLKDHGCGGLLDCPEGSKLDEGELKKELEKEEKEAVKEREKKTNQHQPLFAIQGSAGRGRQASDPEPPKTKTDERPASHDQTQSENTIKPSEGPPSRELGGQLLNKLLTTSLEESGTPSSTGNYAGPNTPTPPKTTPPTTTQGPGFIGPTFPIVGTKGSSGAGVTIKLDSRHPYFEYENGGDMVNITSYHNPPLVKGYNAFQHTYSHRGKSFRIKDFTVGGTSQIFSPGVTPVEDVKSVMVYFSSCGKEGIPLMLYFKDKDGHKWYENMNKGDGWHASRKLTKIPPHKAYRNGILKSALERTKQNLGINCGTTPVFELENTQGETDYIEDSFFDNNYFGRSQNNPTTASLHSSGPPTPKAKPPDSATDDNKSRGADRDQLGQEPEEPQPTITTHTETQAPAQAVTGVLKSAAGSVLWTAFGSTSSTLNLMTLLGSLRRPLG
ncbi:hypothetical protein BEWA_046190 [Theileria equi strain WA]|uniref:Uncharacterized protein n=1 Tax=Theileria equi strain WA TaxID=1537102 RepID=L1LA86_THEEQ|nr:hypothetical protein BEWA_046190 [Theileria equi strain WA]EKX72155.1 hypothetical protein BEWA_046190 [Theileria equi strain WA]|eukprot:XP_004831607.1 hypothetical protein BEWA_046190 [Theileria equi strain WA]